MSSGVNGGQETLRGQIIATVPATHPDMEGDQDESGAKDESKKNQV